jgi:hypothetical protein
MQLSGTSVAAPAVAGAAALLLEKNPGLTPPLVKAILQYTAQQLVGANICQQGAGLMNIEGAVRLAGALRTDIASSISRGTINAGDPLLRAGATFPAASSTIAGSACPWGGYIFAGGSHVLAGAELFKRYQAIYNPALVWVRNRVTINDSPAPDCALISEGVINGDAIATPGVFTSGWQLSEGLADGQGIIFCEGIIFAEGIIFCEGIIFAEGIIFCEGIIFAEGIIFCEGIIFAEGSDMGEGIIFCESFNLGEP